MKHTDVISEVWSGSYIKAQSFRLWALHIAWLNSCGFSRACQVESNPTIPANTGHEVVDLLGQFISQTGLVNAHLGLTSSDIIDNVRLMQINASLAEIRTAIGEFNSEMQCRFNSDEVTTGFTHWQPAAPVTWRKRVLSWTEPLDILLESGPEMHAKEFGGPTGDAASLRLILGEGYQSFDWSQVGLSSPQNRFPIQSSDHLDEMAAVNWICAVAAQLHKIALDLRFLASRGTVRIGRPNGHAGSSSMPHKTNPYKWEKVCAICRSIGTTQAEIWAVMANNSLERTLDGSWQIKHALERCFNGLAYALDEMRQVDVSIDHGASRAERLGYKDSINSDVDLTRQVLQGNESRWSVYLRMLNHTNQQAQHKEKPTT